MLGTKLIINNLKLSTLFFVVALTFGGAAFAQSINDDLKPTPKASQPKAAVKTPTKPAKVEKKIIRQPKKKVTTSNVKAVKSVKNDKNSSFNSETPEQIINRYMNFQQSVGVTEKDWRSVMAQTAQTLRENPNHLRAKAQSLIAQGQIALNQGSYSAAISHFKSALRILPTSSLPYYGLGKVYLANGQAKAAEQSFKAAADRNDDFALAYKGMGDALIAQGEQKKAVKYFKKATESSVKTGSLP